VGYNFTFEAKSGMKIAILAAGYYEGVDRRLSNKGYVKVGNDFCPIVGRVSMNMTTIDVSNAQKPKVGQKVTIYSDNPEDKNSIQNCAKLANASAYELLVKISESVRRELV
jgi:alanine racemase